jgi:UDP-N-acetyl-D-galactosamine dehydrogenase
MRKICVVGLGYVGLPVAVAFGMKQEVIGYDVNPSRVSSLSQGKDTNGDVSSSELRKTNVQFTTDMTRLSECDFFIVAVPTPIDHAKKPDLTALIAASVAVGSQLSKQSIVVYESTVYPGVTEEVCLPILEKHSGLVGGRDFGIGYSPERINPGDKLHAFENIVKVVSGQTEEVLNIIADTYCSVVTAGVHRASSIKVAEAAKVIENTQRDLNIALMNELSIIFHKLDIDTTEVLEAAGTKWNFLSFNPGLVGGHCIGVDPYYLTYKSESIGYHPEVILAGRRINDSMSTYIIHSLIKQLIVSGVDVGKASVSILGLTFKENVADIRNSKVIDMIKQLEEYNMRVQVFDPLADKEEVARYYGINVLSLDESIPADAVIIAVPHTSYKQLGWEKISTLLKRDRGIVVDIKSVLDKNTTPKHVSLWRL